MKNLILLSLLLTTQTVMASIPRSTEQARELMGKRYHKSVVSKAEKNGEWEKNIYTTVAKRLPKKFSKQADLIAKTIIAEAQKFSLDPYFVMAVISGESSFNPHAKGPVGEIGLMQLRLSTGAWMSEMTKTKWNGANTLKDPIANIKLGTAYLAWLRGKFDKHGQLYLAAYNMGPKSVKNALNRKIWPKDYPRHVMKRYLAFYEHLAL